MDGAAPVWCSRAPQTPCTHRAQAGAPFHSLWLPERPDREKSPSPCQEQRLRCGSAFPASTQVQGSLDGGLQSWTVTLPVEDDNICRNPLMENRHRGKTKINSFPISYAVMSHKGHNDLFFFFFFAEIKLHI